MANKTITKWGDKQGALWGGTRCFHSHPPLPISDWFVYGGSCGTPVHDDCDVYVGLDYNMEEHKQRFPWIEGEAIHFKITDGSVPKSDADFLNLIEYLSAQVTLGKKVHIGCIGGHGRTGLVLAALVKYMVPDMIDTITYVREQYCKKAVESKTQVDYLMQHFGCATAEPSKGSWSPKQSSHLGMSSIPKDLVRPIPATFSIWGDKIKPE